MFDKKKFNERQYAGHNAKHFRPENDINQITWQVQSVTEMAEASKYFRDLGVEIMREGRAGGGGSQFHLYVWAPDEQIFELYYGIEQISWNGYARPVADAPWHADPPNEPQLPDYELVRADIEKGINVLDGRRLRERDAAQIQRRRRAAAATPQAHPRRPGESFLSMTMKHSNAGTRMS